MFIVDNYFLAIILCVVTMLCWGSWGNTQKLAGKTWRYELFYWDYVIGVMILSLVFAFTLGSMGSNGRGFIEDLSQADFSNISSAFVGGIIFNAANILLSAAIAVAGMSVAIIINAIAYKKASAGGQKLTSKGIFLSISAGLLMSFFYRFVAASMDLDNFITPATGKMTPYTAVVIFSLGVLISNFLFNTLLMKKPISGEPTNYKEYFKGKFSIHLVGVLGGLIWGVGNSLNLIAAGKAGAAISYGLGQGATLVAALWGIFIWKEFKNSPKGTNNMLTIMLVLFVLGIISIIYAGQ